MEIIRDNFYFHIGVDWFSHRYVIELAWNRADLLGHTLEAGDCKFLDYKRIVIADALDVKYRGWIYAIFKRVTGL